jgi:hypothetical protein
MTNVEIFRQPSDRRHGDFHRHGVGWFTHGAEQLRRATEAARAELLATEDARQVVALTLVSDVASGGRRALTLAFETDNDTFLAGTACSHLL